MIYNFIMKSPLHYFFIVTNILSFFLTLLLIKIILPYVVIDFNVYLCTGILSTTGAVFLTKILNLLRDYKNNE